MDRNRLLCAVSICGFLTLFFPTIAANALAAAATTSSSQPAQTLPEDSLGRSTPYGTVVGFVRAMGAGDSERGSRYLEDSESTVTKAELARLLKKVLDHGTVLKLEQLSREREGHLDDDLSPDLEQVGSEIYGGLSLPILLHRNPQTDAPPIWLFSSETLLGIQGIADQLELPWSVRIWPQSVRAMTVLTVPLFVVINTLLLIPFLLAIAWLLTRGLHFVLRPALRHWFADQTEFAIARVARSTFLLIFSLLLRIIGPLLATLRFRVIATSLGTVLTIVAISWFLVRMTQLLAQFRIRRLRDAGLPGAIAVTELYTWLLVCLWVVASVFLVMRSLGINPSTALAGIGVGGIAVAFAAQKSIENLFGTVTVIGDKAVRVGDRCQAGNVDGWVESIGLRSTRIRTLDRILVSVPNGQLATMNIGNLELRDKFLYRHEIRLRYETTADQIRHVLAEIERMLADHPKTEPTQLGVRFIRFGQCSLDLEVYTHVLVRNTQEFLKIQQEFLLRTMDIVEASGTRLALPSQVSYSGKYSPPDVRSDGATL